MLKSTEFDRMAKIAAVLAQCSYHYSRTIREPKGVKQHECHLHLIYKHDWVELQSLLYAMTGSAMNHFCFKVPSFCILTVSSL